MGMMLAYHHDLYMGDAVDKTPKSANTTTDVDFQAKADEVLGRDADVAGQDVPDDLDGRKVDDLKAYAEEFGVDLGDATKKADIVAAIRDRFAS